MQANKIIVITGGSRGIGKAIANKIAALGYTVAILYQNNTEAAELVKKEIEMKYCSTVLLYKTSVSDYEELESAFEEISKKGDIVGLINNAGIIRDSLLMTMSEKSWLDVIDTNLYGTIIATKLIIPYMKKHGGTIINMSSISGLRGEKGQANYAATKSAICQFTKTVAMELLKYDIKVYAIAPGFVATDMVNSIPLHVQNKYMQMIPAGRYATTDEIAELSCLLMEFRSNYMTGNTYIIDGGIAHI